MKLNKVTFLIVFIIFLLSATAAISAGCSNHSPSHSPACPSSPSRHCPCLLFISISTFEIFPSLLSSPVEKSPSTSETLFGAARKLSGSERQCDMCKGIKGGDIDSHMYTVVEDGDIDSHMDNHMNDDSAARSSIKRSFPKLEGRP
ncbi:hypothetical protein LguiA_030102 [Lonicera macranthoides]